MKIDLVGRSLSGSLGVGVGLCLLLAGCATLQQQSKEPAARLPPLDRRVYVSNEDSGELSVIDTKTDTVAYTLQVGKRPRGLKLSPDGRFLFVAVSGTPKAPPGVDESTLPEPDPTADGIAVVDTGTLTLLRTIESGSDPEAFDLSPDGQRLYVSNEDAGKAAIVHVATGKVTHSLPVGGEPEGVTTSPGGAFVYVTSEEHNLVAVIDAARLEVLTQIPTGPRPRAVAFTPDGKRAFVSEENGASVLWVDAQAHKPLGRINVQGEGQKPMGLTLSPDAKTLFVTTGRGRSLVYVDATEGTVFRTVNDVGTRPWGVGVTRDGRKLYTANGPSNDVSVIDVESGQVVRRIQTGRSPWGIEVGR